MSEQNRPYQGYPYVNPLVIDVPSLDAAAAAKWTNLPRRQIHVPHNRTTESHNDRPGSNKGTGGSCRGTEPRNAGRGTADGARAESEREAEEYSPVVYIDIPDNNASCVIESPRREHVEERLEGDVAEESTRNDSDRGRAIEVQATIDSGDDDTSSPAPRHRYFPPRPPPPSTLQTSSQGGSSSTSSPARGTTSPGLPPLMSKEAGYYGRMPTPDDGFLLAPIPVTEFPEPPPAYTEIDRGNQPSVEQATTPPRTEVVTTVTDPNSTIRPGSDRKLLQCQHCGQRVHSLVVRESGAFTHILALVIAFLCLIPVVVIIYCTDACKYKNHYCPNCNQLIGYEIPILCQQMAFV